jgi:steroid delta-isomerase-like uncharacterized protein
MGATFGPGSFGAPAFHKPRCRLVRGCLGWHTADKGETTQKGAYGHMSAEENKAIARRAYEAVSQNNLDALDELVASDLTDHDPAPGQAPGLEGVKQWFSSVHTALSGFQLNVEDMIAEDDKVVVRVRMSGTHQGEFMGSAPTGNRVTITGIDILRIAEGKIVERRGNFDNLSMMQQLGAIPGPGQTQGA